MRGPVAIAAALLLAACGTTNPIERLVPSPVKVSIEQFKCMADPGAWAPGADDNAIATNRRQAAAANQDCHRQMRVLCLMFEANDQVVGGRCEDLPPA